MVVHPRPGLPWPGDQARVQCRALLSRGPVRGGRQVRFLPVETLLCLAASFLVNHRRFGGGTDPGG
jgi:putative restriction endonuclease